MVSRLQKRQQMLKQVQHDKCRFCILPKFCDIFWRIYGFSLPKKLGMRF